MSLTLGLNTALSGLMTNQRGLDVIAQNVVNVNTKGYTRKVMNPESRVLDGKGAGVQDGGVTRMVNEGLLKDIRRQSSNLGQLQAEQRFYPRIDDLFGEVADNTSISHALNQLSEAFEVLATETDKPAMQWATVQSGQDVAEKLRTMTTQLQDLRLEADREIEAVVNLINIKLTDIHDLNQKIVKNSAVATGTTDLEDKRDMLLTELAQMIDIQYFKRNDGGTVVYTSSGEMLLDNQPQLLSYSASANVDPWMTAAGGQFGKISVAGGTTDFGPSIVSGELRAYLDMRDKIIPDMQATVDEIAVQMKEAMNLAHNRGTSFPNVANTYEGTRIFAKQPSIVPNAADNAPTLYVNGVAIDNTGYGSLDITPDATRPWRAQILATGNPFAAGTFDVGDVFSISGATDSQNDGSYRVTGWNSNQDIIVERVTPGQTIQLSGTDDVVIATFDSDGNQLKRTTLNTIMQTNYQVPYGATPGTDRAISDYALMGSRADWSINSVTAHVEAWLKDQGYTSASVNLNEEGKLAIDIGETDVSLVFRDQGATTAGSTAADVTLEFDVNGDGAADQTIKGFANFFGLNDFYTTKAKNFVFDSAIQNVSFKTSRVRDLTLYDTTGPIGSTMTIPAGSSLQDIATRINNYSRTNESAALSATNDSWTLTTAATITVGDSSGNAFSPVTVPIGGVTLEALAGLLTQGTVTAQVVVEGSSRRLRLSDSRGEELTVSISGGAIAGGSDLDTTLDMTKQQRISAAVVPEGSGYRLRLVHAGGDEIYASSTLTQGKNLLTDLDLKRGATRFGELLDVRSDIRTAPEKISRGAMQWSSDKSQYYLSEGDNTAALGLATTMTSKRPMDSAGGVYAGKFTIAEFAAASISVVASASKHSVDKLDYQTKLSASLDFQNSSFSGVNIDEEVSAMMDFQQAYAASAKVITVLQEMLETLTSMIR